MKLAGGLLIVFVIDLASRRLQIVGSTPHPNERFMQEVVRTMTVADEGLLVEHRVLICDRDTKWSARLRARLGDTGIRAVQTPYQAPNANWNRVVLGKWSRRAETSRGVRLSRARRVGPFDYNGGTHRTSQRLLNELERFGDVMKLGGDFGSELIVHAAA